MSRNSLLEAGAISVWFMYGAEVKSVNNVRWNKFDQKLQREQKVADLGYYNLESRSLFIMQYQK